MTPRSLTYSPLTRLMRELFAVHSEAERLGISVDDVHERRAERMTRGTFIRRAAVAGAGAATAGAWAPRAGTAATTPRIVIVGAGLAGLRAAHKLANGAHPLPAMVYEADTTHVGGRCWSLRGYFDKGLVAEHGGAFINHDQQAMRGLASSLGLELEVVNGGDLPKLDEIYWFDGKPYTYAEANADWGAIGFPAFRAALKQAPFPQLYNSFTAGGRQLDNTTIPDWLDQVGSGRPHASGA
jgi:monoamine oxidase